MSDYIRVLPRDLFNEASLLKCVGRLWLLLGQNPDHRAAITPEMVDRFEIGQDDSSGSISIENVTFSVGGVPHRIERPLNSRAPWPLVVTSDGLDPDFDEVQVFDDNGDFTPEMLALITAQDRATD